jgi:hypothetical protein
MSERLNVHRRLVCALAALMAGMLAASAQVNDPPKLNTHQSYIEEVTRPATLDVKDPLAVFAFVLNSLPERVKVYPTVIRARCNSAITSRRQAGATTRQSRFACSTPRVACGLRRSNASSTA